MARRRRKPKLSVVVIDAIGGCATLACIVSFVWLTLIRSDRPGAILPRLRTEVSGLNEKLAQANKTAELQRSTLTTLNIELTQNGRLPDIPPIDEYSQALTKWANHFELEVKSHKPLAPREYPGLMEHRFAYQVEGTWPNLLRFFQYIEGSDYWADVSYVKIGEAQQRSREYFGKRSATLTFSVFAAPLEEPTPDSSSG